MFPQLDQQHLDQSIEKPWQLVFSARSPVPLRPLKRWSPGRGYLTGFFSEAKTNQKIASFWWPGRPLIYSIQTPDEQKIMSIKIRKALRLQYSEIMNCMQLFLVYLQIWILWIMFHQKNMTASSMEHQVDLTGVVVFSYTTWIWIWEFGSGRRSGRLFLGICPNIFWTAAGNSATQCIYKMFNLMLPYKSTHPYKSSNNKIPSKLGRRFYGRNLLSDPPPFSCAQRLASRNVTSCVATTLRLDPKFLTYQTCPKTQHDANTPFSQGFLEKHARQFLGETQIINKRHVCFWW